MSLFTDVITVFNHSTNQDGGDIWKRTIIKGVQWTHAKLQTKTASGIQTETRVESLTIDFNHDYGNDAYTPSKSYTGNGWTLNSTDGLDIVVLGEITQDITDEYPLEKLFDTYEYVGKVTEVIDNRNRRFLRTIKVTVV